MYSQLKCDYFRLFRTQTTQQTLRSIFPKLSFKGVSIIRIFFPLTVLKVLLLLIWPYTQPLKEKKKDYNKISNQIQKTRTDSPHWQIHRCPRKNHPGLLGCTVVFFIFAIRNPAAMKICQRLLHIILWYCNFLSVQSWDSGTLMF